MYIQQLSLAILAMVIFFSFIDYKKTVLLWLPAQLLFNAQVAIRYESPAMSLQIAVNIFLLGYYYLKCNIVGSKKEINRKEFPFWKVSIFILLSYILSSIVSPYGTFRGFTSAIKYFVTDIGSVFLAFKMIESDKDVRFFIKSCFFVFLLIVSLGISEFILKDNLWADFVYVGSPHDETTEGRMFYVPPFLGGGHEMRYGMIRAISTFGIHIAFGVSCVVYFWLFLVMKVRRFSYISSMKTTIMIVLLLIGVFLCNSKTGMVGLVLILLSVFPIGQLLKPRYIFPFLIGISLLLIVFPEYLLNFVSLVNTDVAAEGGGSSVSARQQQLDVAMRMFFYNPVFGNGIGSIDVLKEIGDNSDILGAESVWMQILPERGLFGMLAHCYLYIAYYKYLSKRMPHRMLLIFLLTIIVMSTATGEITQSYWGVVLIAVGKMFDKHIMGVTQTNYN